MSLTLDLRKSAKKRGPEEAHPASERTSEPVSDREQTLGRNRECQGELAEERKKAFIGQQQREKTRSQLYSKPIDSGAIAVAAVTCIAVSFQRNS